jgi:hypothetical protein
VIFRCRKNFGGKLVPECHLGVNSAEALQEEKRYLCFLYSRGDKDIFTVADALSDSKWQQFICSKAGQYDA